MGPLPWWEECPRGSPTALPSCWSGQAQAGAPALASPTEWLKGLPDRAHRSERVILLPRSSVTRLFVSQTPMEHVSGIVAGMGYKKDRHHLSWGASSPKGSWSWSQQRAPGKCGGPEDKRVGSGSRGQERNCSPGGLGAKSRKMAKTRTCDNMCARVCTGTCVLYAHMCVQVCMCARAECTHTYLCAHV